MIMYWIRWDKRDISAVIELEVDMEKKEGTITKAKTIFNNQPGKTDPSIGILGKYTSLVGLRTQREMIETALEGI